MSLNYRVLYSYTADDDDEVSVREGQKVRPSGRADTTEIHTFLRSCDTPSQSPGVLFSPVQATVMASPTKRPTAATGGRARPWQRRLGQGAGR